MKWFKFYGQDWLTDLKVMGMSMEDRLCFITLLCLASAADENGLIRNCSEDAIIRLSNIPDDPFHDTNPQEDARGFLERCNALQIVTLARNGDVTVNAFALRQGQNLSNSERQKKYRERLKIRKVDSNDSNVTLRNDSNARIDKNRIDKNIMNSSTKNSTLNKFMKNYNETDFSDSGERVIDADSGEERNKKPKAEGKNKVALRIQHKFADLCKKNIGTIPVQNVAGYQISLFALNTGGLTELQIYDLFEEWFSLPEKKDEQLVSITQALSANSINGYRVRNKIK